ncbi:heterokaryon incompatibility protein-domain-containing protein [Xylaria scruposa]|nr:heterokaryon incompatibility protein-domain-containing protein [Xylaria scruposa]
MMGTHKYTKISGPQEIRLLILLPGKDQEDIKVAFEHVVLNEHSQFEALSYVWGSENEHEKVKVQTRPGKSSSSSTSPSIPINTAKWSFEKELTDTFDCRDWEDVDETIQITKNLAIVLEHLRYEEKPRILWVDAVCIDQGNPDEKGEQVNRMGSNYENAQRTIVWLGPDATDGKSDELYSNIKFAFDLFHRFYEQSVSEANDNQSVLSEWLVQPFMDCFNTTASDGENFGVRLIARFIKEYDATRALLQRPWWNRMWIVQETCKSRAIDVYFGHLTIKWNVLSKGIQSYLSPSERQVALPERFIYQIQALFAAQELRDSHPDGKNLLSLLHRYRWCRASNPRDKIYGILGLASKGPSDPKVEPNYKIDIYTCYRDTTLEIMRASGNLDILQLCPRPRNLKIPELLKNDPRPLELPSWVPDFSYDIEWMSDQRSTPDMELYTLRCRLEGTEGLIFTASGNSQCYPEFDGTLTLQGIMFDTISDRSEILEGISPYRKSRLSQGIEAMRPLVNFDRDKGMSVWQVIATTTCNSAELLYDMVQTSQEYNTDIKALRKWKEFAFSLGHYPTNESLETVFYSTMVQGHLNGDIEECIAKLKKSWQRIMKRIHGLGRLPGIIGGLACLFSLVTPNMFPGGYTCNQRLAKTSKGYLALVSYDTEIGDKVALLAGGKTPFVIRGDGHGRWKLIRDCYIEGVMRGEQWRPELCKELEFI